MQNFPEKQQQVIQTHSSLIRLVVHSLLQTELQPKLEDVLTISANNGWTTLVAAIRKIIAGERNRENLGGMNGLDEEDTVIINAILNGIQNPALLPDNNAAEGDATMAAPGIAHMIHEAATGSAQALVLLSNMAEQMSTAGGDMSRLGGIMKTIIDGERDPDILCKGMAQQGRSLVISILDELGRIQAH
ncbi:MAG: hypothetical protein V3U78_04985 [Thiotrichaceae bacterium]